MLHHHHFQLVHRICRTAVCFLSAAELWSRSVCLEICFQKLQIIGNVHQSLSLCCLLIIGCTSNNVHIRLYILQFRAADAVFMFMCVKSWWVLAKPGQRCASCCKTCSDCEDWYGVCHEKVLNLSAVFFYYQHRLHCTAAPILQSVCHDVWVCVCMWVCGWVSGWTVAEPTMKSL